MELIIKNNDTVGLLITDKNKKKEIDLRYYPFEIASLSSSIYMYSTMQEIFNLDGYNSFESCVAGLSLLGGIPSFNIKSTIINIGKWDNMSNWSNINSHSEIQKKVKELKHIVRGKNFFSQEFIYKCDSDLDILKAVIFHFLTKNGKVKKCNNCNRWFMTTTRSDTEYCDRKIESNNITCKELNNINAKKRYRENEIIKKKEAIATYYYTNNEDLYSDFLNRFEIVNKKYKDNEISKEDILKWLEDNRAKEVVKRGGFTNG